METTLSKEVSYTCKKELKLQNKFTQTRFIWKGGTRFLLYKNQWILAEPRCS